VGKINKSNIKLNIDKICDLILLLNSKKKATYSSSRLGVETINYLKKLCNDFLNINSLTDDKKVFMHYSKGVGCLPRILWIAFTYRGKPSNSPCVALCFDKNGKGFVMGFMDSVTMPNYSLKTTIRRSIDKVPEIDVDGPHTKYANKFINPKDFFKDKLNTEEVISHFQVCLQKLKEI